MPSEPETPNELPIPVKVVVAGGFGVGKTTVVGSLSDIAPLRTEGHMTSVGLGVDDATQVQTKTTTTVAMDFGRAHLDHNIVLYVFGTPGQDRFGFMWDDLVRGALGGIVLVDTRRLEDCYVAIDFFESRSIPFIVAINRFDGVEEPDLQEVRWAIDIDADIPLVTLDARDRASSLDALLVLLMRSLRAAEDRESVAV